MVHECATTLTSCERRATYSNSRTGPHPQTRLRTLLRASTRLWLALIPSAVILAGGSFAAHAAPPTTWTSAECASVGTPCTPSNGKKFYPGIYALYGLNWTGTPVDISDIAGKNQYVGIVSIYRWRDIEPTFGSYDFSRIDGDKTVAKASGRKLGIYLRVDNITSETNPATPSYMWNDPSYGGVRSGHYGNYYGSASHDIWKAMVWNANVKARLFSLLDALAKKYNNDPDVAFVLLIEETTGGATTADDPNYSCGGEIQAVKDIMTHAWSAFPNTPAFVELDYACTDIPSNFHQFVINGGVGAWTIDGRPTVAELDKNAYSLYRNNYSKIAGAIVMEGWTDINAWPGYLSAAQIMSYLGPGQVMQPRYFLVDHSNSPNQASINQAVDSWWVNHGSKWPLDQRPSGW
jgi:hypothetical protein